MSRVFTYITDLNNPALDTMIDEIVKVDTITLDIESNSLDPITGTLLLVQIKVGENIYIFDARQLGSRNIGYLIELINTSPAKKIIQNALFDVGFLEAKTGHLVNNIHCTMIAEAIISGGADRYTSLEKLSDRYLDKKITLNKSVRNKFADMVEGNPITQEMLIYSAEDVDSLEEIYEKQIVILEKEHMLDVMKLEMDLVPVVVTMISNGVLLDVEAWTKQHEKSVSLKEESEDKIKQTIFDTIAENINNLVISVDNEDPAWKKMASKLGKYKTLKTAYDDLSFGDKLSVDTAYKLFEYMLIPVDSLRDIKALEAISIDSIDFIKDLFFERFNVDSTYQLRRSLGICGIFIENAKEDTLVYALNDSSRTDDQRELLETILSLKEYSKRVSSFGLNFLEHINPKTGRIHADVYQIGTVSGRFAYSNPNLQQIPGLPEYRHCFIAPEGSKIVTSDYSQQEIRLAGDLAEDEVIIEAYKNNEDIHAITGAAIYEIPIIEVDPEQRGHGKTLNFQTLYGATKWGVARKMGIPLYKAEEFIQKFFGKYKQLAMFKEMVEDIVFKELYSVTPLGRKRYFKIEDKIYDTAKYEYEKLVAGIRREGFNHPIQGGSADMLKQSLIYLHNDNPFGKEKFKILMVIHDEVVVEATDDIAEEAREFIINTMNKAGNEMMQYISAETESNIENYWSK